jgi:hypothetical protein
VHPGLPLIACGRGVRGGLRVPTSDPHTINACWSLFLLSVYLVVAEAASFDKKELCRSDTEYLFIFFALQHYFIVSSIIYLPRVLCLSYSCHIPVIFLSYSCRIPVVFLSSCCSCGTLSYSLGFSNQTDQGDKTEGL